MQPFAMLPLFIVSLLAQEPVPFDPWKLYEKFGFAAVFGLITWILWKRSEKFEAEDRKKREALEQERLELQRQMLAQQQEHGKSLQGLIVADIEARMKLNETLEKLESSVKSIPCGTQRKD